jgi:hypothetical protein
VLRMGKLKQGDVLAADALQVAPCVKHFGAGGGTERFAGKAAGETGG